MDKIDSSQRPGALPSKDVLAEIDKEFRLSLQKELPGATIRLRLYLEDSGTVSVLLTHVQSKIIEEYSAFREAAWSSHGRSLGASLLSVDELRNLLDDLCQNGIVS